MKFLKKISALAVVLMLTLAMTTTAFATQSNGKTYQVTIDNSTKDHIYEAYQILAGNLSSDEKTLANITWGSGISKEGQDKLGDAVAYAESLGKLNNDSDEIKAVASTLNGYLAKVAGTASTVTDGKYVISNLPAGYYLIKDKDNSLNTENTDSYTSYILSVVKSTEVKPKSDVPTSEKKVKDVNDTTGVNTMDKESVWIDSADYDIGDDVPFQFTGTIAKNFASYSTYKYAFHDKESKGLKFNKESVKVYVVNGTDSKEVDKSLYNTVTENLKDGCTFEIEFADLKKVPGVIATSKIVVEYTSQLTTDAVLGSEGNPNEMRLEFSNNPNGEGTGKTPWDKVIVFTYKVVVNKVDGDNKPLAGAEFTLYKKLSGDNNLKEITSLKTTEGTTFEFKGLDDGDYVLKETKTPDGYNTINDIEFTVTAAHDIVSDDPRLTELNGDVTSGAITFTSNVNEGSLTTDVVNKKGSVLPAAGGAGRTLIYVFGAVLVLGAGVVLVTKKRVR